MSIITKKPLSQCVNEIIYQIDIKKTTIKNRQLISICQNYIDIFKTDTDPHTCHEIAENALNFLIQEKYAKELLESIKPHEELYFNLEPLSQRLPTQTWRSNKQIIQQQFSTPPQIAYFVSYLLNLKTNEIVLEPSAGTGCLAVWAKGLGLRIFTNEIDVRRQELLDFLGFESTSFNAEYINDFLIHEINPDVLIMNPPFSSNGGRTKNNSSKFGFRHVSSALERLKSGGKFGIILGNSAGLDTRTGKHYWQKMSDKIRIKAIIIIGGREHRKYGTNVDINLIIGTKFLKTQENNDKATVNKITSLSIDTIEEGFELIEKLNLRLN